MNKTKVFAAYLPQYHITEDNNKFWGEGYTDWEGVKKARPLFEGHNQPRIPLNNNYYDLSDYKAIEWQAETASQYGIDGFDIYHYWFKDGKQELEKPAELLLAHPEIDIEYYFTWDNCAWRRTWSNVQGNDWAPLFEGEKKVDANGVSVLVDFDYGGEDQWTKHFDYLLQFFRDCRYLKIDNKPVFAFMTTVDHEKLTKMAIYWDELAKQSGFSGMYLISQKSFYKEKVHLNNTFIYEPITSAWGKKKSWNEKIKKYFHIEFKNQGPAKFIYDYERVWRRIIRNTRKTSCIHSCFVRYDDTPRRGKNAGVIVHDTSELFGKYFRQFYQICSKKAEPFVLITAWNEWGEGAYLEPDASGGYSYLEALKRALE